MVMNTQISTCDSDDVMCMLHGKRKHQVYELVWLVLHRDYVITIWTCRWFMCHSHKFK